MSIEEVHKLLCSGKNYIKINTDLLKLLNTEEAILYSYLVPCYYKNMKNDTLKYFADKMYMLYSHSRVEDLTGLSAFKQRNALNGLQKKNLLWVKLGQARTKYICINEDSKLLERILYGFSVSDFETAIVKYIASKAKTFQDDRNSINYQYLINHMKKTDFFNNFEDMELGWISKPSISKTFNQDEICV